MTKFSIAVIGPSGFLGKPVLDALQSDLVSDKIEYPIKVLTRSEKTSTEKLKYFKVQWIEDQVSDITSILKGTDVIIELISPSPDTNHLIEEVLKQVNPKLFIPSQFGLELPKVQAYAPGFLEIKSKHSKAARNEGIKVVDVYSSLFAVPGYFLYEFVDAVGIDVERKEITYRGNPDTQFPITKLEDIGKSVAVLATSNPKTLPDLVRIQSEVLTYQDVVLKYEKDHDVKLKPKTISKEQTLKEFKERFSSGFNFNDFPFYLNAIIAQGVDKGAVYSTNENELVNPDEKLWKWGKY